MKQTSQDQKSTLSAQHKDVEGNITDRKPVLTITAPDGSSTVVAASEMKQKEDGSYAYEFEPSSFGLHAAQWTFGDESDTTVINVQKSTEDE